jgi:hypothetical protein
MKVVLIVMRVIPMDGQKKEKDFTVVNQEKIGSASVLLELYVKVNFWLLLYIKGIVQPS